MKHLVVAGLLTAIGSVALVPVAQADSWYCISSEDDPRCDDDPDFLPQPPPGNGDEYEGEVIPPPSPPRQAWRRPQPPDWGEFEPPPPPRNFRPANIRHYCDAVGRSLRQQGYRRVRAVECGGKNFKYHGYKHGERFLIKVKARTGRIIYVIND